MNADVRVIDFGIIDRLARNTRELTRHSVTVGIHSDAGEQDGVSIAEYATFNEYGTDTIPARPFMRHTADVNAQRVTDAAGRLLDRVVHGMPAMTALRTLGEFYVDIQKRAVRDGPWTPNAPSTVAQKGSSRPLIDHGVLINAIRAKVE